MTTGAPVAVSSELPPGYTGIGEYLVAVDLATLRLCPYADGHAVVHGFFEEKVPIKVEGGQSVEVPYCPRTLLRRVTRESKEKHGAEFLVGFESEFILLESTSPAKAINDSGWCSSSAFNAGTSGQKVLDEIAKCIKASGIELQMYHSESAPGQYEVVTGPLPPLEAVDALINTRQVIFNVASKHGLRATFAPRVYSDNCGTACHAHISVHTPSTSQPASTTSPYLNTLEAKFLSGILKHLTAISVFTLPLPASYARVADGIWSGGTWVAWGIDNKEVPIRLCNAHSASSRNFEVKCIDGVANPYYALAAVIGAGMDGVATGEEVKAKDCSADKAPSEMDDAERALNGVTDRMALSWEEAITKLETSQRMKEVLGAPAVEAYLAVNKCLAAHMGQGSEEEAITRLVENY
ncbi:glutamine synthetase guanido kinase [Coniophora puteana RWD-64-598 SS2]|uniref:Glutamine synthetase guanido kinase n=1 Tax=Coniophora puteana (strain RWD-64-598) TaxID=741705 RepID=A0A5M3ME11_CONPW|nr:glutamine synthetase guanido kinase [Coniophora puteana RWD-64-598 SS2]EIW77468.1 glutamine synthetase guanido kinase [Coniophora puteana RWD-64-598 SS2]